MPICEMQRYVALFREGDATIEELQTCLAAIEYKIASYACVEAKATAAESSWTERETIK
jgi:hypothetical protein